MRNGATKGVGRSTLTRTAKVVTASRAADGLVRYIAEHLGATNNGELYEVLVMLTGKGYAEAMVRWYGRGEQSASDLVTLEAYEVA